MEQQVYEILSNILETPANAQTALSMSSCPAWTSLAHIDIIMSCEETFDIAFGQEDLPTLTSQEALIAKIAELVNAK
ncbi:acyl carrier protein [Helicobacter jaachi]|uniref:Acyl carrier protein n=1 Tax=Helicobacter jaachi TaxID=1677920 RepID=A0A4U8TAC4_9HELI|nr:acyl carrier protein [Helicobacter jaachi]TLD96624.1 acyl carrier protein [Helicobacter jaachi]